MCDKWAANGHVLSRTAVRNTRTFDCEIRYAKQTGPKYAFRRNFFPRVLNNYVFGRPTDNCGSTGVGRCGPTDVDRNEMWSAVKIPYVSRAGRRTKKKPQLDTPWLRTLTVVRHHCPFVPRRSISVNPRSFPVRESPPRVCTGRTKGDKSVRVGQRFARFYLGTTRGTTGMRRPAVAPGPPYTDLSPVRRDIFRILCPAFFFLPPERTCTKRFFASIFGVRAKNPYPKHGRNAVCATCLFTDKYLASGDAVIFRDTYVVIETLNTSTEFGHDIATREGTEPGAQERLARLLVIYPKKKEFSFFNILEKIIVTHGNELYELYSFLPNRIYS